jgi:hypothetical protein
MLLEETSPFVLSRYRAHARCRIEGPFDTPQPFGFGYSGQTGFGH